MLLEVRKYLFDILMACQLITEFTMGQTFEKYRKNAMLRSAVERQFEIIGEALNKMLKLDPSLAIKITDSRKIIDFRNILIHGYSSVSDALVWGVVEAKLPKLYQEVRNLLEAQ